MVTNIDKEDCKTRDGVLNKNKDSIKKIEKPIRIMEIQSSNGGQL